MICRILVHSKGAQVRVSNALSQRRGAACISAKERRQNQAASPTDQESEAGALLESRKRFLKCSKKVSYRQIRSRLYGARSNALAPALAVPKFNSAHKASAELISARDRQMMFYIGGDGYIFLPLQDVKDLDGANGKCPSGSSYCTCAQLRSLSGTQHPAVIRLMQPAAPLMYSAW